VTDVAFVAVVAAVPATMTALAGLLVSLRNGQKANTAATKQEEIHTLVNSNMTNLKAELAAAKAEIAELREMIVSISGGKKEPQ